MTSSFLPAEKESRVKVPASSIGDRLQYKDLYRKCQPSYNTFTRGML